MNYVVITCACAFNVNNYYSVIELQLDVVKMHKMLSHNDIGKVKKEAPDKQEHPL